MGGHREETIGDQKRGLSLVCRTDGMQIPLRTNRIRELQRKPFQVLAAMESRKGVNCHRNRVQHDAGRGECHMPLSEKWKIKRRRRLQYHHYLGRAQVWISTSRTVRKR